MDQSSLGGDDMDGALKRHLSLDKSAKKSLFKKKEKKSGGGGGLFGSDGDSKPKIDVTSGINNLLMKKKQTEKLDKKKTLAMKREADEAKLHATGAKTHKNILKPVYKYNDRLKMDVEDDPPPSSLYISLGYDKSANAGVKHYRRFYQDELENNKEIFPTMPFHTCTVTRG
jgi:hypothetical protein